MSPVLLNPHRFGVPRTYSQEVLADTPLAYYRLGEASGTSMLDSSGNARNGTYINGPVLGATGIPGTTDKAVTFDGVNDRGQVAYASWMAEPAPLTFYSAFTVEAWVKPSSVSGGTDIIVDRTDLGSIGNNNYQFYLKRIANATYGLFMRVGGVQVDLTSAAINLAVVGQWAHLQGIYDGSAVTLKLDGNTIATTAASGPFSSGGTLPLSIGSFNTTNAFPGVIDEVALYSYALSDARGDAHYLAGITP